MTDLTITEFARMGGFARAKKLTPKQRKASSEKAIKALKTEHQVCESISRSDYPAIAGRQRWSGARQSTRVDSNRCASSLMVRSPEWLAVTRASDI